MALAAIFLYLHLALAIPLQLLTPQLLTLDSSISLLNLPTTSSTSNATALTVKAHCFIQPHHPGAPTLHDTNYKDCRDAVSSLLALQDTKTLFTFGRGPNAQVRLPRAASYRTCKVIIDIMDETETERLRWQDIRDALEAPKGVLRNCLGGFRPPLGGKMSVGEKGVMQAIVAGQVWRAGDVD